MKKRTFLISMIAATLMVASCSKDDGDTIDNPVVTVEQSSTDGVNNVEPQTKSKPKAVQQSPRLLLQTVTSSPFQTATNSF